METTLTRNQENIILQLITDESDVVGFTVAEYLPFDEERLYKMFEKIRLFTD